MAGSLVKITVASAMVLLFIQNFLMPLSSSNSLYKQSSDDAFYVDKYFNSELRFYPLDNEIIVRWRMDTAPELMTTIIDRYQLDELHAVNQYYGHGHYRTPQQLQTEVLLEQLSNEELVVSAIPVFRDETGRAKYVVGHELTVRFMPELDETECATILAQMGSSIAEDHFTPGYYTVTVPEGMTLFQAIRAYNQLSEVKFAEFSAIGYDDMLWIPNDQYFPNQQNLRNTGQISSCSGCAPFSAHDIETETGWDESRGDPNVVIAIIDTGVDWDHPDLAGNILPRGSEDWDFADPGDSDPNDESGHGTSCAGIAAAVADNSIGIAGIANLCKIMPLRIDLSSGMNQNRADAINYAASRRPLHSGLVLSNSWRMSSGSFAAVYDAIENAHNAGCVVVFAAGNENHSPVEAPADSEYCICVSAISPCDELKSTTSCDGENFWGSSYGAAVDLCAPGVLIRTTTMGGGYTSTFNGTSSACPHIAGAAALVLSIDPSLSALEVQQHLQTYADDLGTAGRDDYFGYGRINLGNALSNLVGVSLNQDGYRCQDLLEISVRDNSMPATVTVQVSCPTEPIGEFVALAPTVEPGNYFGTLTISSESQPIPGDGLLSVTEATSSRPIMRRLTAVILHSSIAQHL